MISQAELVRVRRRRSEVQDLELRLQVELQSDPSNSVTSSWQLEGDCNLKPVSTLPVRVRCLRLSSLTLSESARLKLET
jgi:hypothetical protein